MACYTPESAAGHTQESHYELGGGVCAIGSLACPGLLLRLRRALRCKGRGGWDRLSCSSVCAVDGRTVVACSWFGSWLGTRAHMDKCGCEQKGVCYNGVEGCIVLACFVCCQVFGVDMSTTDAFVWFHTTVPTVEGLLVQKLWVTRASDPLVP